MSINQKYLQQHIHYQPKYVRANEKIKDDDFTLITME